MYEEIVVSKIIALHGFLGRPKDFQPLRLKGLYAPDILATNLSYLTPWSHRFNQMAPDKCILLGYSMGGRLALHCLLDDPKKYTAAIILAAHPGIENRRERKQRLACDLMWAHKFQNLSLGDAIQSWNQAPIFSNSILVPRQEHDFSRRTLINALWYFSLGRQEFLSPLINQLPMPILWLYPRGEIAKINQISLKHQSSKIIGMDQGGHRFLFSEPMKTASLIKEFLCSIRQ